MERFGKNLRAAAFAGLVFGFLLSCENPFEQGLGNKVDIIPPTLNLVSPSPTNDRFLSGVVRFSGKAEDDRSVSSVSVSLDSGASWQAVDSYDSETKDWYFYLDTLYVSPDSQTIREDGPFSIRFMATDNSGKPYESIDFNFYAKNRPPELELQYPQLKGNQFVSGHSDNKLNYPAGDRSIPATGGALRGFVTDMDGIAPGYPKIKFWKAADPEPADYHAAEFDERDTTREREGKILTAKAFRYTLVEGPGNTPGRSYDNSGSFEVTTLNPTGNVNLVPEIDYRMRLVVKDKKGVLKYYPPAETDAYVDYQRDDGDLVVTDHRYESSPGPQPIVFQPKKSAEKVEIEPYYFYADGLEETLLFPAKKFPVDDYHRYVNESQPVYKHDDFVFQVLTTHSEGVDEATLAYDFYEYSNLEVPRESGPLYWDGDKAKPQADRNRGTLIPLTGQGDISQGRIFKFTASLADPADFAPLAGGNLAEGVYKLKITGMSSGNDNTQTFTIHVDKTKPDVQINTVTGGVLEADDGGFFGPVPLPPAPPLEFYRVNGTIRVSVSTFDRQSGLRSVKDEEKLSFDRHEQKWLLIPGDSADRFDALDLEALISAGKDADGNEWYFPADTPDTNPGEDGYFEGSFLIKDTDRPELYSAGVNYLYFFGRDQSFNVFHSRVPFYIDQPADRPAIRSGDSDFNLALTDKNLMTAGNMLDDQRGISLILEDDDSLDLSTLMATPAEAEAADAVANGKRKGIQIYLAAEAAPDTWYQLPASVIAGAFGSNSQYTASNGVVHSLERTLKVSHLAGAAGLPPAFLTGSGDLIDGKYKLKIILTDWQDKKEPLDDPAYPLAVSNITDMSGVYGSGGASRPCEFWFAVDRGGPAILIESHPIDRAYAMNEFGKTIPPASPPPDSDSDFPNGFLILSGTVTDANGLDSLEIQIPFVSAYAGVEGTTTTDGKIGKGTLSLRDDDPDTAGVQHTEGTPWVYDWTYRFDVETAPPGSGEERRIAFRARDKFGNESEFERTLLIDEEAPTVSYLGEVAMVSYDGRANNVNGTIHFSVSPDDNNFLADPAVKWWLLPHVSGAPNPALDMIFWSQGTAANASHEGTINTAELVGANPKYPAGEYRLYVGVKDTANNITLTPRPGSSSPPAAEDLYRLVYVVQDADYPQIVESELRPNNNNKSVLGSGTAYISGLVRDDDGFNPGQNYVYIRLSRTGSADDLEWTAWTPLDGELQSGGYELKFELNLKAGALNFNLAEDGTDDGDLYYQIYVLDEPQLKGGDPALNAEAAKAFYRNRYYPPVSGTDPTRQNSIPFTYDTQAPRISFDSAQDKGIFRQLPSLVDVFIEEKNFHIGPAPETNTADQAGLYFSLANKPYKRLRLGLQTNSVDDVVEKTPSDQTGTRQFRISRDVILSQIGGQAGWDDKAAFPDGSYNIMLQAVDEGGSTGQGIFAFTKDTAGPDISFNNIVPGEISVITDAITPEIRGKFSDALSPVQVDGQPGSPVYRLYKVPVTGQIDTTEIDTETHQVKDEITEGWTLFPGSLLSGTGKVVEWKISFDNSSVYRDLPDGLYKIELKAVDTTGNISQLLQHNGKNILFRLDRNAPELAADTSLVLGDPEYDSNNPVYLRTLPAGKIFGKIPDTSNPDATVFTVYGTISDPNLSELKLKLGDETGSVERLIQIPANVLADDYPVTSLPYVLEPEPGRGFKITLTQKIETSLDWGDTYVRELAWEYRVRKDEFNILGGGDPATGLNSSAFPDGEYPLYLNALDSGGRAAGYTWRFTKDGTPPLIEFTSLEAAANTLLSSANPQISILVTDDNTVRKAMAVIEVWDYLDAANERPAPVPPGDKENGGDPAESGWWKPAAYQSLSSLFAGADEDSVSHEKKPNLALAAEALTRTLDGFPEGKYRIRVEAQDYSVNSLDSSGQGNPTASPWKVFYVDPHPPVYARDSDGIYINKVPSTDTIRLRGTVYDPNRVVSVRGKINSGADFSGVTGDAKWTPADAASGYSPATAHTWEVLLDVSSVSGLTFTAYLEFLDYSGMTEVKAYEFTLDDEAPTFNVTQPMDPAGQAPYTSQSKVTGTYEFRGSANDNFAIGLVEYSLGEDDIANDIWHSEEDARQGKFVDAGDKVLATWTGGWSWCLEFPNIAAFAGGTSPGSAGTPGDPGSNAYVTWVDPADSGNDLAADEYNVWKLPLKLRITDVAGNSQVFERAYFVDPDGDKPRIEFIDPEDGAYVDGEIQISGAAFDNDKVYDIAYRVLDDSTTSGVFDTPVVLSDRAEEDKDTVTGSAAERWYKGKALINPGTHQSSQLSWNFNLNSTGQFTNTLAEDGQKKLNIQVAAWDSLESSPGTFERKTKGDIKEITVTFQRGAPVFTSDFTYLDRDADLATAGDQPKYSSYPTVKGEFLVVDQVTDDIGIQTLKLRKGGTGAYTDIPIKEAGDYTATPTAAYAIPHSGQVGGKDAWDIYIPVDVAALGTDYALGAKTYRLEIQAADQSQPRHTTTRILDIRIDNFSPIGVYTGSSTAIGTNYSIQGKISDYHGANSVSGVSDNKGKVLAWFQNTSGNILKLDGASKGGTPEYVTDTTTYDAILNRYVIDSATLGDDSSWATVEITAPNVTEGTFDSTRYNGIWIKKNQTGTHLDASLNIVPDGDNTTKSWQSSGSDVLWLAQVDTTKLPSGPVDFCYLIFDDSGNVTAYKNQRLIVSNGRPVITGVLLGTDLYNRGSHYGAGEDDPADREDERFLNTGYEDSGVIARNSNVFVRGILSSDTDEQGSGTRTWRLMYIEEEDPDAANMKTPDELSPGKFYRIDTLAPDTNWQSAGAPAEHKKNDIFMATQALKSGTGLAQELKLILPETGSAENGSFKYLNDNGDQVTAGKESHFEYTTGDFGTGTGKIKTTGDLRFILKVYDSTSGGGDEKDQLSDFKVIGLKIDNGSAGNPAVQLYDLNPGTETAVTAGKPAETIANAAATGAFLDKVEDDGSFTTVLNENLALGQGLYNAGNSKNLIPSGHIEPRKDTAYPALADKTNLTRDILSGAVILRGYASDDQRIDSVELVFSDSATPDTAIDTLTILKWDDDERKLVPADALYAYTTEILDLRGHRVQWSFLWNTQDYPAGKVIYQNLVVTTRARDLTSAAGAQVSTDIANTAAGANAVHNRRSVDLAPFITGFKRDRTKAAAVRTKQGWYAVDADGTNGDTLIVQGYNLVSSGGDTAMSVGSVDSTPITGFVQKAGELRFALPDTTKPGMVVLTAKTTNPVAASQEAINSLATNTPASGLNHNNPWNKEGQGRGWDSGWNDQRRLRVWQSNSKFGGTNNGAANGSSNTDPGQSSIGAIYPAMTMEPGARNIYGSWSKPGNNAVYVGKNDGATGQQIFHWVDPMDETDVAAATTASGASADRRTVVYNNTGAYTGSPTGNDQTGGIQVYDTYVTTPSNPPGLTNSNGHAYIVEKVRRSNGDHILDRFASPHVAVQGDYMHVAYHDRIDRSIKYWWNKSGNDFDVGDYYTGSNNGTNTIDGVDVRRQRWINLDGGYNTYDDTAGRVRLDAVRTTADYNGDGTSIPTDSSKNAAGEYNAIDYDSLGYPVIAYYDMKNQKLRLAYAHVARPLAASNWSVQDVVTETPSGQYVSMRIDRTVNVNRIHLSYYKSDTGELVYVSGVKNTGDAGEIDSNSLTAGAVYRINKPGDTDWTSVGAANNNGGTYFIATGTAAGTGTANRYIDTSALPELTSSQLVAGEPYKIKAPGDINWTLAGAANNTAGTSFIAATSLSLTTTPGNAYEYSRGTQKNRNALIVGNLYRINTPGNGDWTNAGAANSDRDTIFIATATTNGGTTGNAYEYTGGATLKDSTALSYGNGNNTKIYKINTPGHANWTLAGAANNNAGTYFVSTRALSASAGTAYPYVPAPASGQSYTFDDKVVVDSTGAVGKWSDISIDRNGNPWITYQDLTRTGSYDAAKLAYLPGAPKYDGGALWKDAANWEAMNIPARYRVQDARLSVENPLDSSDGGWDAAVGYQSDYFRAAYYQDN
jgi:hypothetical protein